jgi:hypothetical protein
VKNVDYMLIVSRGIHGMFVSVANEIMTSIDTCKKKGKYIPITGHGGP